MGYSRSILFYILCSKNNISSRKVLIINLANSRRSHICVNNLMVYYISRKVKSYIQFSANSSFIYGNKYICYLSAQVYIFTHICHIYIKQHLMVTFFACLHWREKNELLLCIIHGNLPFCFTNGHIGM